MILARRIRTPPTDTPIATIVVFIFLRVAATEDELVGLGYATEVGSTVDIEGVLMDQFVVTKLQI